MSPSSRCAGQALLQHARRGRTRARNGTVGGEGWFVARPVIGRPDRRHHVELCRRARDRPCRRTAPLHVRRPPEQRVFNTTGIFDEHHDSRGTAGASRAARSHHARRWPRNATLTLEMRVAWTTDPDTGPGRASAARQGEWRTTRPCDCQTRMGRHHNFVRTSAPAAASSLERRVGGERARSSKRRVRQVPRGPGGRSRDASTRLRGRRTRSRHDRLRRRRLARNLVVLRRANPANTSPLQPVSPPTRPAGRGGHDRAAESLRAPERRDFGVPGEPPRRTRRVRPTGRGRRAEAANTSRALRPRARAPVSAHGHQDVEDLFTRGVQLSSTRARELSVTLDANDVAD